MNKRLPIQLVMVLARFVHSLRIVRNAVSRMGIFRLGFIIPNAVWFQLQLSGFVKKPERLLVTLRDAGEKAADTACASVTMAELAVSDRQTAELWYQIQATRDSKALESMQDLFAVALLSSREKSISIAFAGAQDFPYNGVGMATFSEEEVGERSGPANILLDPEKSSALAGVLTKPFFQSEIAPNDYLKRVSEGRRVVLVSVSEVNFGDCWRQFVGNLRELTGEDAGSVFVLVDGSPIPGKPALPDGLIVQSLETLGFTGLERLALARNVDVLVTDHAPSILSALSRRAIIISPASAESGRLVVGGNREG